MHIWLQTHIHVCLKAYIISDFSFSKISGFPLFKKCGNLEILEILNSEIIILDRHVHVCAYSYVCMYIAIQALMPI